MPHPTAARLSQAQRAHQGQHPRTWSIRYSSERVIEYPRLLSEGCAAGREPCQLSAHLGPTQICRHDRSLHELQHASRPTTQFRRVALPRMVQVSSSAISSPAQKHALTQSADTDAHALSHSRPTTCSQPVDSARWFATPPPVTSGPSSVFSVQCVSVRVLGFCPRGSFFMSFFQSSCAGSVRVPCSYSARKEN